MSSGYSTVDLEAMRAAQIRQELQDNIDSIKAKLKESIPSVVGVNETTNWVQTVFAKDDITGGTKLSLIVDALDIDVSEQTRADRDAAERSRGEREELDFTSLIFANSSRKPSRAEMELDSLLEMVEDRPVLTEKDVEARKRLHAEIASVIGDDSYDIQSKIDFLRLRINTYIRGGKKLTPADEKRIEDNYLDYCALCALLGMNPVETIPYRVEQEVRRMTAVLAKRRENEYVMEVLEEVMVELGCHVKEEAVMGGATGQLFSVDGNPVCDVFMSVENSGIMFETVAGSREGSTDQKRRIESSAQKTCDMYSEIEKRAAEKGVILKRVYLDPADINSLSVQSDITEHKGKKKRRKAAKKLREMKMDQ